MHRGDLAELHYIAPIANLDSIRAQSILSHRRASSTVEEHTGRLILIQVGPTFLDSARLFGPQLRQWEPIIERIADFFLRMRGQDAEIAATVHFASQRLLERMTDATENDVLHAVMMWKQRRKPPLGDGDVAQS